MDNTGDILLATHQNTRTLRLFYEDIEGYVHGWYRDGWMKKITARPDLSDPGYRRLLSTDHELLMGTTFGKGSSAYCEEQTVKALTERVVSLTKVNRELREVTESQGNQNNLLKKRAQDAEMALAPVREALNKLTAEKSKWLRKNKTRQ